MSLSLDVVRERPRHRKLTAEDVYRMRCAACDGVSHERLADAYEVSQSTATRAISGKTFRWVSPASPWESEAADQPSFGWMPFPLAQSRWEATREVEVRVAPRKPRLTAKRLFDFLDDWERRDDADGTAQRRRDATAARIDQMMNEMWAGTWCP
jgi:hypothetical protein